MLLGAAGYALCCCRARPTSHTARTRAHPYTKTDAPPDSSEDNSTITKPLIRQEIVPHEIANPHHPSRKRKHLEIYAGHTIATAPDGLSTNAILAATDTDRSKTPASTPCGDSPLSCPPGSARGCTDTSNQAARPAHYTCQTHPVCPFTQQPPDPEPLQLVSLR